MSLTLELLLSLGATGAALATAGLLLMERLRPRQPTRHGKREWEDAIGAADHAVPADSGLAVGSGRLLVPSDDQSRALAQLVPAWERPACWAELIDPNDRWERVSASVARGSAPRNSPYVAAAFDTRDTHLEESGRGKRRRAVPAQTFAERSTVVGRRRR